MGRSAFFLSEGFLNKSQRCVIIRAFSDVSHACVEGEGA
jgi:hypothetical protein